MISPSSAIDEMPDNTDFGTGQLDKVRLHFLILLKISPIFIRAQIERFPNISG
jgi:hypothetical protein